MSATYIENQESSAIEAAWNVIGELTNDPRILELPLADAIRAIAMEVAPEGGAFPTTAAGEATRTTYTSTQERPRTDAELLDWLEEQAAASSSGVCLDHGYNVEEGQVLEKGWRFMRRHYMGPRGSSLREAIDLARDERAKV